MRIVRLYLLMFSAAIKRYVERDLAVNDTSLPPIRYYGDRTEIYLA